MLYRHTLSSLTLTFIVCTHLVAGQYFSDLSGNLPPATATSPTMDVAAIDIDGDNDLDILIANEFSPNLLLLNDGGGRFSDVSAARLPQRNFDSEDIAVADFDRDGDLDIVFVSEDNAVHEFYLNDGNAFFTDAATTLPSSIANAVAVADFNQDMYPDLVFGNNGQNFLLINDRQGGFQDEGDLRLPARLDPTQDIQLVDVDNDGDVDLLAGNEDRNRLLINDGSANFEDQSSQRLPQTPNMETRKIVTADVDGDGDIDLFLANVAFLNGKSIQNRLYLNDGKGFFSDASSESLPVNSDHTLDAVFIDFDRDKDLDLITVNFPNASHTAFENQGDAIFKNASATALPASLGGNGLAIIAADFTGDGNADIYIGDRGGQDRLLGYNNEATGVRGGWLPLPPELRLYPNPLQERLLIEPADERASIQLVECHNGRGQRLFSSRNSSWTPGRLELPVANWRPGVYWLTVQLNDRRFTRSIVKH